MSKKTAVLSAGYWFSATTLGMLLHPYKTMRKVLRKKSLWLSVLAPVVWGVIFWLGAVIIILTTRLLGLELGIVYSEWIYKLVEFLFWWAMWFLVLWQVLVGYLFFRFKRVFDL